MSNQDSMGAPVKEKKCNERPSNLDSYRFPLSFLFSGFFFHGGNLYKDKERLTHVSFLLLRALLIPVSISLSFCSFLLFAARESRKIKKGNKLDSQRPSY